MIVGVVVCERKAARRYPVTANALDAAAVSILFATFFASHALWKLVPALPTFLLLALVAAVAVLLSIRHESLFIAVLGLLGGFSTPALLSTGENRPIPPRAASRAPCRPPGALLQARSGRAARRLRPGAAPRAALRPRSARPDRPRDPAVETALAAEQEAQPAEPAVLQPKAFWAILLAAAVVLLVLIARLVIRSDPSRRA
jgi:hypothetical protein